MAVSREHSWKNKRKRSLYVEEGFAGFIFYRKNKISCPVIEEIPPIHEEERTDSQPTTLEPMEDEAADSEVSPLSDGQLERLVEVRSFVDQLRKEMCAAEGLVPEDKLEEVCRALYQELRGEVVAGTGAYIQYLEATEEEDKLPPHPLDGQLTESIRQLQQKIELCEKEAQEWEALMEVKKTEAQTTTQDLESNLSVDLSQLGPEDEAKLASHLPPEQQGWLDQATSRRTDREWERKTEADLRAVSSRIDRELERIKKYASDVLSRCSEDTRKLGAGLPTETPRALFRALKDST